MSAKNKKYKKPAPKVPTQDSVAARPQPTKKLGKLKIKFTNIHFILLAVVVAATFYCYHDTPKNEFTNWDDGLYVETDNYIKNLTPENIKMILFHNITNNYYHPLTMITFAANYHFAKMDPHAYYVTEVCIFLMDAAMMFCLALVLLETINFIGYGPIKGIPWLAGVCAIFYGCHPMHVESAAWIAERKDIMYVFFYFLGIIMYAKYSLEETSKRFFYVVLCFILSLLSKPMAVSFPLSLFALDVLLKRDKSTTDTIPVLRPFSEAFGFFFNLFANVKLLSDPVRRKALAKLCAEKMLFILICVAFGLWAYIAADKAGSIASFHAFSLLQKLFFASHNFMMYFYKAFVPEHLCSYYPYPNTDANGYLPIMYYLSPLVDIAIIGAPLYFSYKAGAKYFRVTLFGLSFFFANVIFILQIISAGPAIMADRYSDMAYFGIFFTLTYYLFVLVDKKPNTLVPVSAFVGAVALLFAYLCHDRTLVWHSTKTLWGDVIQKYPYQVETSYKNLGNYYADRNQMDSAYDNYIVLVKMKSRDAGVYSNVANIWGLRKQFDTSLAYYSKAIALDSNNFDVYLDRAITYSMMGNFPLALKDYNKAYQMDHNNEKLLENRAYTYLSAKQYQNSVTDYNKLIQINPDRPMFYFNRGVAESDMNNPQAALPDFMYELKAEPGNANCLYDISVVYQQLKDYQNALSYALKAKQGKYPVSDTYIKDLQDKVNNPGK
jgi:tetratricopeptide (TPR) repeat protein